eukprot:UN24553
MRLLQSQILIQVKKLVSQGIFCTVSQLVEILHQIERLRFAAYDFREHFYILIQTGNFLSRTTSKFPSSHFSQNHHNIHIQNIILVTLWKIFT